MDNIKNNVRAIKTLNSLCKDISDDEKLEDLSFAIKVLKMRVPKKVIKCEVSICDQSYKENYYCPNCDRNLRKEMEICEWCGQFLKFD